MYATQKTRNINNVTGNILVLVLIGAVRLCHSDKEFGYSYKHSLYHSMYPNWPEKLEVVS